MGIQVFSLFISSLSLLSLFLSPSIPFSFFLPLFSSLSLSPSFLFYFLISSLSHSLSLSFSLPFLYFLLSFLYFFPTFSLSIKDTITRQSHLPHAPNAEKKSWEVNKLEGKLIKTINRFVFHVLTHYGTHKYLLCAREVA